jgi:hypothetical protein
MFLALIVIVRDGNWTPTNGMVYGTFVATITLHGVLATILQRWINKLQTVSVVMNLILAFATIIALPIGARHHRHDGAYIFGHSANLTTWPAGWAFMIAWLSPIWTIGDFVCFLAPLYTNRLDLRQIIDLGLQHAGQLRTHQRRGTQCYKGGTAWNCRFNWCELVARHDPAHRYLSDYRSESKQRSQ